MCLLVSHGTQTLVFWVKVQSLSEPSIHPTSSIFGLSPSSYYVNSLRCPTQLHMGLHWSHAKSPVLLSAATVCICVTHRGAVNKSSVCDVGNETILIHSGLGLDGLYYRTAHQSANEWLK